MMATVIGGAMSYLTRAKNVSKSVPRRKLRQSYDDALEHVKAVIAYIKAMREHPFVQELREKGCDPEQVELLRVGHEKFGHRWVIMDDDQIRTGAEAFAAYVEDKMAA